MSDPGPEGSGGGAGPPVAVVGLLGGQWFGRAAEAALRQADVLLGHARQFAVLPADIGGERVELWGDLDALMTRAAAEQAAGRRCCILADGDPGFHGPLAAACRRLGEDGLAVHPAPSSIALAFARVGTTWHDAVVASARHSMERTVDAVIGHPKVAVLVTPDQPPEAVGRALVAAGCGERAVTVCSRLAEEGEHVVRTDLAGLAAGTFDPVSVVVLRAP